MPSFLARCAILGLVAGAVLGVAGPALGDSSTIAGEPTIVPGRQVFGNFSGDAEDVHRYDLSFWGLPVIAGDRVTINWEGDSDELQVEASLYVEPIGTPDGLDSLQLEYRAEALGDLSPSGRDSVRFTAPQTGIMPLAFSCYHEAAGPYDFTANVLHRVDMRLPGVHRIGRTGKLRVQARDPDGHPLTVPKLTIRLQRRTSPGHWATIGTASPRNGGAHVHYVLPTRLRNHVVHLRAQASGGGYFTRVTGSSAIHVS